MFNQLPVWVQIFLLSMIPGLESRFVVPYSILEFGWEWWQIFPIAIAGNMLLVPFILRFYHHVERFGRRFRSVEKTMDWVFSKVRCRANKKIQRYECAALLIFVAIPLPFTGAGLGSLIAYLFDLPFYRALLMIFLGVIISASITTFILLSGQYFLFQ